MPSWFLWRPSHCADGIGYRSSRVGMQVIGCATRLLHGHADGRRQQRFALYAILAKPFGFGLRVSLFLVSNPLCAPLAWRPNLLSLPASA